MYSLKKNFERAKVVIIAELTKFFLHFPKIFFPTGNFSRNCGCFRDISPLRLWFLLVLRRFPGHFTSATVVSPDFAAFSGTIHLCDRDFSWICGIFRDISHLLPWFLPDLGYISGHFSTSVATFYPEKMLFIKKTPNTMKKKILPIIISIFWIAFFSYLTYIKMYAVVILSLILLGMSMAMSISNEAES